MKSIDTGYYTEGHDATHRPPDYRKPTYLVARRQGGDIVPTSEDVYERRHLNGQGAQ